MNLPKITLKKGKEEALHRFHPWIFSGAIHRIEGNPHEGDVVEIFGSQNQWLAIGHYQIGSITVRILSFTPIEIDAAFWLTKIQSAYNLRVTLGLAENPQNTTYRLIHGEGDLLPGLIIDIYDNTAVIQAHTVAMHLVRKEIANTLMQVVKGLANVFYKSEGTLPFKADVTPENCYLIGKETDCIAMEYGLKFQADWLRGQKTGFFVDQRENRFLLEKYAKNRSVLNMFCYTGGFSFYALRGGAEIVHSVDSSAKAIELTNKNVALNFPDETRHEAFADDAFKFMEQAKDKYDLIILDPPAFAKHKNVLSNALRGYQKLNAKAIEQIRPNGILFTFSCSQVVSKEQFRLAVFSAAAQTGRNVRILHQLTQPADHPINIYHAEGEYLKGLVLYVE